MPKPAASPAKAASAPAAAKPAAKSAAKPAGRVRNTVLARGINKLGRSQALQQSGRWRFIKKGAAGKKTPAAAKPTAVASSKWYAAEDVPMPHKSRKSVHKPTKLRGSITPGTVLIVLTGRFRGKRVVFLKQLPKSGLLLVTGPYKVNGVPLRRINQAYVIATSAKVALTDNVVPDHVDDAYFARVNESKDKIRNETKYKEWLSKRQEDQKKVDAAVSAAVAKVSLFPDPPQPSISPPLPCTMQIPLMKEYMAARFTVTEGAAPHLLKF